MAPQSLGPHCAGQGLQEIRHAHVHLILFLAAATMFGGATAQSTEGLRAPSAVRTSARRCSKSWTINFDRSAKSDGQIKLLVWQNDQDAPTEIVVPVTKGQTKTASRSRPVSCSAASSGVKDFETNNAKGNVFVRVKHGERRFSSRWPRTPRRAW